MLDATFQPTAVSLTEMAMRIADESVVREALIECAAKPTLEQMRANLEPHRRHDPSAVDSIGISIGAGEVGNVRILVGAVGDNALPGTDGMRSPQDGKREGWILRFLEDGTSKQGATPWARPALDAVQAEGVGGRLAAWLATKISELVRAA